ncbi:MAG: hypothetical protein HYY40_02850 [Bacteroidetes bacterium]|nr:hypothetical protein [Bacteroidota bacterium]
MSTLRQQFITDDHGKKVAVLLPIQEYKKILDELEEIEDIILYDEAKAGNGPSIPIDEAFKMIEAKRRKKA